MKKAFIFLAPGFEEIEATGIIDVLRRGEIETTVVSIIDDYIVLGAHGIALVADVLFEETDFSEADALILPGGMPGSSNLNAFEPLKELFVKHYESGKIVAAICAAPLVLGGLGILKGRRATCYPGYESQLTGAILTDEPVVVDGNVITGKGPGFVFDFGLTLVNVLKGPSEAEEVAGGLLI
ncbi:MAG: DJ-1/PfpI family protein [Tannerellaceae bacterium]|jgi:4-methyl-5(b-hydroxyethyl)-thiazole monophosphate biosynthesis|nr:DJ-1/PfpI family protein [Tannerellaceae bacterium]